MNNINIGKNYIIRLSAYKNALSRFNDLGFVKVFSDNLADAIGVTSVQVRKDFSLFGISGNKKGGYQVVELIENLNKILGKDNLQKAVVVGLGSIGSAMVKYKGFEKEGIAITAAFDIDSTKQDNSANPPILPIDDLQDYIKTNKITIGIIAVPDTAAQSVADSMVSAGIKGILNFAPIRLRTAENIVVNNVNLVLELENVIYFVNAMARQKKK